MSEISNEDVAARLVRALRLDCVMPDRERSAMRYKVLWPGYEYDRGDLNAQAENHVYLRGLETDTAKRRSWDTRAARTDYDEVMGWLVELSRLTGETLAADVQEEVRALRRRGLAYLGIASKLGVSARAVGLLLGVKREIDKAKSSLSIVEFVRRIALEWDFESIGTADGTDAEGARRRWAGIVVVAADVVNGRIGKLHVGRGVRASTVGASCEKDAA